MKKTQLNFLKMAITKFANEVYGNTLSDGDTDLNIADEIVLRLSKYFDKSKIPELSDSDYQIYLQTRTCDMEDSYFLGIEENNNYSEKERKLKEKELKSLNTFINKFFPKKPERKILSAPKAKKVLKK